MVKHEEEREQFLFYSLTGGSERQKEGSGVAIDRMLTMVGVTVGIPWSAASSVGVTMVGNNQSHLPLQSHCSNTFFSF